MPGHIIIMITVSSCKEFDPGCRRCPRISDNLQTVRQAYPHYHAGPVPPFGAVSPELLVVGLGPGMHGANATGRPFTGDYAGILLYRTLYEFGLSNQPESNGLDDDLRLYRCRITNAVKCLPPANKPLTSEILNCNAYLTAEINAIKGRLVILALGRIAHTAVLRALGLRQSNFEFSHNGLHTLEQDRYLLDSYHCSRYNTQTRRLTEPMFREVFVRIAGLLA